MKRNHKNSLAEWGAGLYLLLMASLVHADAQIFPFEQTVPLTNQCAVFRDASGRIVYGEPIPFNLKGTAQAIIVVSDSGNANLKFQLNAHGAGIGATSGIKYQFNAKAMVKANTTGDVQDPNFRFSGRFRVEARVIGQGRSASEGVIAQGAQDNARLSFFITVRYVNQQIEAVASDFKLECMGSPWYNEMTAPNATTRKAVGRGFGDVWNKYAWSMKDFAGGLVVGTKNAWFNYQTVLDIANSNASPTLQGCFSNLVNIPEIYRALACTELYDSGSNGSTSGSAQTRFAEIWRFDYVKKNWTRVRDETSTSGGQGFRIMQTHGGKLYAGSDLGSFVMGVKLGSWNGDATPGNATWDFPGSRVLVSADGKAWTEVPCSSTPNPCASATASSIAGAAAVNSSFRALASYGGKLHVGTFNFSGGEVWAYDAVATTWAPIAKFSSNAAVCASPLWNGKCTGTFSAGVTELLVDGTNLLVGVSTSVDDKYLWTWDGSTMAVTPGLPSVPASTFGVLELFRNSKGQLFAGLLDLTNGFTLVMRDPVNGWQTITTDGFGNANNAYAWSMAEVNGRTFLGTFNKDFFVTLPRGSSELWYTDNGQDWLQHALPLNWGLWNYGIRTMEFANKMLYLGTASNIVAPDLQLLPDGTVLSPGTEVWSIRATAVSGGSTKK
jgi:hypothetical protein